GPGARRPAAPRARRGRRLATRSGGAGQRLAPGRDRAWGSRGALPRRAGSGCHGDVALAAAGVAAARRLRLPARPGGAGEGRGRLVRRAAGAAHPLRGAAATHAGGARRVPSTPRARRLPGPGRGRALPGRVTPSGCVGADERPVAAAPTAAWLAPATALILVAKCRRARP